MLNYSGDCNSAGTSGCYYQTATDPQYPELPVPDDAPKTYYRMNYSNGEWNISGSSFSSLEACING